ncbi:formimidoylglutamase [Jeotgalicoccus halotolerans]|uniref:Formiminoglutamase n=1 Tax=Jeotgalicoccus halotolerans TaxID=157227 RepID=A0A3E0AQY8_9STAP|nr:formimidoylglutamase [Jeotgalicoccus halotolerans]REG20618.1 formiminoglutamase [Jeotgalicoccus halotolerans]
MNRIEKYNYNGRTDDEAVHERIHQVIKDYNGESGVPVITGFSSDEGVKRNKGTVGAAEGPFKVREKMSSYAFMNDLYDFGTIIGTENLEQSQQSLGDAVYEIYKNDSFPIIIGGGHETFYGHYLGGRQAFSGKIAILNFDAHLDLRDEIPSSGTMFHQILSADQEADYYCLGLQPQGNTKKLYDTADKFGVRYYTIDEVRETDAIDKVAEQLENYDAVLMTLCMDSIQQSASPGVSAPSPNGYTPLEIHKLISRFATLPNLKSFDVSEVSPPLDINDQTSAMAASIIHKFLSVRASF